MSAAIRKRGCHSRPHVLSIPVWLSLKRNAPASGIVETTALNEPDAAMTIGPGRPALFAPAKGIVDQFPGGEVGINRSGHF
jgi:hypothetical protein